MTGAELRPLLDAVAEADGPLTVIPFPGHPTHDEVQWLNQYGVPVRHTIAAAILHEGVRDQILGSLKRDLEHRGLGFETSYRPDEDRPDDEDPWLATIMRPVFGGGFDVLGRAGGDTELQALLEAWTDAAALDRWGEAGS